MIIGRRTFIQRTVLVAATPTFASLLSLSSTARSHTSPLSHPLQLQPAAGGKDMNCTVFKIVGWDRCDDPASDQAWIGINQSWKIAWR